MKLTLDAIDLKAEYQDRNRRSGQAISTSMIKFGHFTLEVQECIKAVGKAQFRAFDDQTYAAIYPPKEEPLCNGHCVKFSDIDIAGNGIAYSHPECPLHKSGCTLS